MKSARKIKTSLGTILRTSSLTLPAGVLAAAGALLLLTARTPGATKPEPKLRKEALARTEALRKDVTQGALRIVKTDGEVVECPLRHTDVKAEVSGFVARVRVTQTFFNPLAEKIEAVYVFPLPHKSAVDEMTMVIGKRRVVGVIKPRAEARQIYEEALARGATAALLEQERPNIFTQSVGNIKPHQEVRIEIAYVDVLEYDMGVYTFHFPMVVGPRYIPGRATSKVPPVPPELKGKVGELDKRRVRQGTAKPSGDGWSPDTDRVPDAARITPPVLKPGFRTGHDISLSVRIDAGVPVRDLKSHNHKADITRTGKSKALATLARGDSVPNKDFVLKYAVVGKKPEMALLTHTDKARGGYFMLMVQPAEDERLAKSPPREIVFLIDVSGSMRGKPTAKVVDAMQKFLKLCKKADTLQVITFAGSASRLFARPIPATGDNINKALRFTEGLAGGGGTEMLKGIKMAINEPLDDKRVRIVLMLTDGFIGNEAEIIKEVGKRCGDQIRFWCVGIGSSPNRFLLDGVARQGGGMAKVLGLDDDPAKMVGEVMDRIHRAQLAKIKINWGGLGVSETYPARLPELWAGRPVILFGRYAPGGGDGEIAVTGLAEGQPVRWGLPVRLPAEQPAHDVLAKVWARNKIEELMHQTYYAGSPAVEEAVTAIALKYRLMSQYTSFVAVDESEAGQLTAPARPPRRMLVPVPIPEGTCYEAFFGDGAFDEGIGFAGDALRNMPGQPGQPGQPGLLMPAATMPAGMPLRSMTRGLKAGGGGGGGRLYLGGQRLALRADRRALPYSAIGGSYAAWNAKASGRSLSAAMQPGQPGMPGPAMVPGAMMRVDKRMLPYASLDPHERAKALARRRSHLGSSSGGFSDDPIAEGAWYELLGYPRPWARLMNGDDLRNMDAVAWTLRDQAGKLRTHADAGLKRAKVLSDHGKPLAARAVCAWAYLLDDGAAGVGQSDGRIAEKALAAIEKTSADLGKAWAKDLPALSKRLDLVVRRTPAPEALAAVARAAGLKLEVVAGSEPDAASIGCRRDLGVTWLDLRNATAAEALDWITRPIRMTWRVEKGKVVVGTARRGPVEAAWVYDVTDIAIPGAKELGAIKDHGKIREAAAKAVADFLAAMREGLKAADDRLLWHSPGHLAVFGDAELHKRAAKLLADLADPKAELTGKLAELHKVTVTRAQGRKDFAAKQIAAAERARTYRPLPEASWRLLSAAADGELDIEALTELQVAWSPRHPEIGELLKDKYGSFVALRSLWAIAEAARALPREKELAALAAQARKLSERAAEEALTALAGSPAEPLAYCKALYAALALRDDAAYLASAKALLVSGKGKGPLPGGRLLAAALLEPPGKADAKQLAELASAGVAGEDMVVLTALACRRTGGQAWNAFRAEARDWLSAQPLPGSVVVLVNRLSTPALALARAER